jgi:hypothetical protein
MNDAPNEAFRPNSSPARPGDPRPGSRRRKAIAVAAIAALAGLGGVALNSNKGMPPQSSATVAMPGHKPIVTRTSGSTAVAQPVAGPRKHAPATPIVTRTSGGRGGGAEAQDD